METTTRTPLRRPTPAEMDTIIAANKDVTPILVQEAIATPIVPDTIPIPDTIPDTIPVPDAIPRRMTLAEVVAGLHDKPAGIKVGNRYI
jgi:hypothetical protein